MSLKEKILFGVLFGALAAWLLISIIIGLEKVSEMIK